MRHDHSRSSWYFLYCTLLPDNQYYIIAYIWQFVAHFPNFGHKMGRFTRISLSWYDISILKVFLFIWSILIGRFRSWQEPIWHLSRFISIIDNNNRNTYSFNILMRIWIICFRIERVLGKCSMLYLDEISKHNLRKRYQNGYHIYVAGEYRLL